MNFGKLVVPRAPEVVESISGDNLSREDTNENLRQHVSSGLENELFLTNGVPETAPSSSLEPGAYEEGSAPYSFSWGDSLPSQRRLAAESLSLFVCLHRSLALTDRYQYPFVRIHVYHLRLEAEELRASWFWSNLII